MSLFDIAMEYAAHRTLTWGRMLIVARSDSGFGYRILVGKREPVPVVSVPNSGVDGSSLALLAWLFGRHSFYMNSGPVASSPAAAKDIWRHAEEIFGDLCLLADIPRDAEAFVQQRQAMSLAS